ncbi:hypothetical protein BN132_1294 [Cronobacter turicensis 564]|nr:hypothetical protein BN132_1294 [Cronobacter turicensis 564]
MGIDHNLPRLHQRRHTRRVAGIFDEHQEGRGVRHKAAVVSDAVGDSRHAEFTHAVVNIVACRIFFQRCRARPDSQVAGRQIRRAAKQLRQRRSIDVQRVLGSLTGGDFRRFRLEFFNVLLRQLLPVFRHFAAHAAIKLRRQLRVGFLIGREFLVPARFNLTAFFFRIPAFVDFIRNFKRRVVPAELFAGQRHFFFAECRAVGFLFARFVRRAEANHGATDNQRRFVGDLFRFFDGALDGLGIVAVNLMHHVPVVGFKTFGGVVGKPALGLAINGNTVVIVEANQLAEAQRARERADLMGDALHQAAVAHKHIGIMIDDLMARTVELRRERFLGNSQTNRVRQPLTERPGGGFHARRIADFRVARRFGVQLAEVFQLFHRQIVAREVQQAVEQHRRMTVGKNKAVAVIPCRVSRVVLEEAVPQHFGDIRHPHRGAGVTGFGFLNRVHAERADGVG